MDNIVTIFELADILIENASYDCPMDIGSISEHIAHRYNINESDVKAQTERILSEYLDVPLVLGIALRQRCDGYYVDLPFSETDIVILRSMLLSVPYCERWQINELYRRLDNFLPFYMRDESSGVLTGAEKYSGSFYENMTAIIQALYPVHGDIRKIRFEYCEYNESLELEPRISAFDGNSIRTVDPIKIVCVNNFFYLVAFYCAGDEIRFINYRIDRMKNVVCTDVPAERFEAHMSEKRKYILDLKRNMEHGMRVAKQEHRIYHEPNDDISALDEARRIDNNGFNLGEYIYRSKIMYTDKMVDRVRVRLDKRSLNGVVDLYGFDIDVRPFDEKTLLVDIHNVTEITIIKWAMQFGEAVEVLEPLELRTTILEKLSQLTEKYRKGVADGD